jgi:hypothetical protein
MMAKDTRIVIRLEADDKAWLHEQAEELGVDDATFVRMMIRQARRGGKVVVAAPAVAASVAALADEGADEDQVEPEVIDDLVSARLAEAERTGQAAPVPQPNGYHEPVAAVRPLMRVQRQPKDWRVM